MNPMAMTMKDLKLSNVPFCKPLAQMIRIFSVGIHTVKILFIVLKYSKFEITKLFALFLELIYNQISHHFHILMSSLEFVILLSSLFLRSLKLVRLLLTLVSNPTRMIPTSNHHSGPEDQTHDRVVCDCIPRQGDVFHSKLQIHLCWSQLLVK
jgi:hypothetical protein